MRSPPAPSSIPTNPGCEGSAVHSFSASSLPSPPFTDLSKDGAGDGRGSAAAEPPPRYSSLQQPAANYAAPERSVNVIHNHNIISLNVLQPPTSIPTSFTVQAPRSAPPPPPPPPLNDYIKWSIFNFLCCLWPLGLAAIVFSCLVKSEQTSNYEAARRYSHIAKSLNIAATVSLPVLMAIVIGSTLGASASRRATSSSAYYSSGFYSGNLTSYTYIATYSYLTYYAYYNNYYSAAIYNSYTSYGSRNVTVYRYS